MLSTGMRSSLLSMITAGLLQRSRAAVPLVAAAWLCTGLGCSRPLGQPPHAAGAAAAEPGAAPAPPGPTAAQGAARVDAAAEPCPAGPEPAAASATGYDRLLTGYAYPFEVRRFELSIQGSVLCMAYMDVAPEAPNGHVVLLLHGKNFSGAYWRNTADALLARGYRVILPDQIGFGKSSKPTSIQYSFDLLARNTARLLEALGVVRASVVGHSMGGMLAVRWAVAYPERTDRLVLVNPIGLEDYRRDVPYAGVDAWQARAEMQGPEQIRQYMQDSYFHGTWQPAYDSLLDIRAGWAQGPDRVLLSLVSALTQDMIYTQPVVHDLPRITAPTLLVIGQKDRTAPGKAEVPPDRAAQLGDYPALGERAARAIPGARLVRLEGVGHVPQYEAFDRWQAALFSFLPAREPAP